MANNSYALLSEDQRKILSYDKGTVVIKACPGSGKTYSVAARISKLLNENEFQRKGIAALSFTNVACDEITEKLTDHFGVRSFNKHPHFLGTIDRFVNHYIFLPFGHLVMKCPGRPELVGEPYSYWTKGKGERKFSYIRNKGVTCVAANPDGYFDSVTFDINNEIIPIVPEREIHFSLKKDKYYKKNGDPVKRIQELIDSKWKNFKLGFANQSDANYISLKVLEKYPLIAENIANQFEYFIIDEAQDTDEIQMRIIDILHGKGANNIMLVGDRDQAIFEWNSARPELFDDKYNLWDKIELIENRRSSQKICNFIKHLSSFPRIQSVDKSISAYDYSPEIFGFDWPSQQINFETSKRSFTKIIKYFIMNCEQHGIKIDKSSVAVLYRGKNNAAYLDIKRDVYEYDKLPWLFRNYHVKDIVRGLFLYENGFYNEGYKFLEKGFIEALNKNNDPEFHCTSEFIQKLIIKGGFLNHRKHIFQLVNSLAPTKGKTLTQWITLSNTLLQANGINIQLAINQQNGAILIEELFGGDLNKRDLHPFYYGTIHSAKGKTFEAVLLILGKKPGNNSFYSTMLTKGPKPGEEEELRNVYVAISRPRKILMMATPNEDVELWKKKFSI